jgi:hypothetical protein
MLRICTPEALMIAPLNASHVVPLSIEIVSMDFALPALRWRSRFALRRRAMPQRLISRLCEPAAAAETPRSSARRA